MAVRINLLTHGVTGVAIGAEPVAPDAMSRPPRPPEQSVLGRESLWQRVLVVSTLLSVAALGLGVWAHHQDRAWQTLTFLALACLQLGVTLGLRAVQLTRANPLLPLAIAGSFLLALAGCTSSYSRIC